MQSSTVPVQACSSTFYAPRMGTGAYSFLCLSNLPNDTDVSTLKHFLIQQTDVKPKKKVKFKNNAAQFRYDTVEERDHAFRLMQGKVFHGRKLVVRKTADELRRNRVKAHTLELDGYAIEITNFRPKLKRKGSDLKAVLLEKQIYNLSASSRNPFFLKDFAYLSFETEKDQEIAVQRLNGLVCDIGNPALRVTKRGNSGRDPNAKNTVMKGRGKVFDKPKTKMNNAVPVQNPCCTVPVEMSSDDSKDSPVTERPMPGSEKYSYLCISNLPDKVNPVAVKRFLVEKTSIDPEQKFKFKHNLLQFCYESEQDRDESARLMQGAVFNGQTLIVGKSVDKLKKTKMNPSTLEFEGYPIEITKFQPTVSGIGSELRAIFLEKQIYELSLVDKCPFFLRGVAYLSFRTEADQKIAVQRLNGVNCAIAAPMLRVTTRERSEKDLRSRGYVSFGEGGVLIPGRKGLGEVWEEGRTIDGSEEGRTMDDSEKSEEEDDENADHCDEETSGGRQLNPPSPRCDEKEVDATSTSNRAVLPFSSKPQVPEDGGVQCSVHSSMEPIPSSSSTIQSSTSTIPSSSSTVQSSGSTMQSSSSTIQSSSSTIQSSSSAIQSSSSAIQSSSSSSTMQYGPECEENGPFCICVPNLTINMKPNQLRKWAEKKSRVRSFKKIRYVNNIVQLQYKSAKDRQEAYNFLQGASWKDVKLDPKKTGDILLHLESLVPREFLRFRGQGQSLNVPAPDAWSYYLLATNLPHGFDEKKLRKFLLEQDGKSGCIPQRKMRTNGNIAQFQFLTKEGREKGISRLSGIQWDGRKIYLERTSDVIDNLQPRPKTIEGYGICVTFDNPVTQDGYLIKQAFEKAGIFRLSVVDNSLLIMPHKAFLAFEKKSFQEAATRILDGYSAVGLGTLHAVSQYRKFCETFTSYVAEGVDDIGRVQSQREAEGEEEEEDEDQGDEGGTPGYSHAEASSDPSQSSGNQGFQQPGPPIHDFHSDDFGYGNQSFQHQNPQQFSGYVDSSQYGMGNQPANFYPPGNFYQPNCWAGNQNKFQQNYDYSRGQYPDSSYSYQYGARYGGSGYDSYCGGYGRKREYEGSGSGSRPKRARDGPGAKRGRGGQYQYRGGYDPR